MLKLWENSNPFWDLLLKSSTQAAVLIVVVLLAQWLFRKKLSPRLRYALWWLVLVRLALPVLPESTVSIFNLAKAEGEANSMPIPKAELQWVPAQTRPYIYPVIPPRILDAQPQSVKSGTILGVKAGSPPQPLWFWLRARFAKLIPLLPALWMCGVILLAGRILLEQILWTYRMRACRVLKDAAVLDLLDECKRRIGVKSPLRIIETSQVRSPALYGMLRPWLLLPEGLLRNFNPAELRHVFLHELAHLKRHDIAVNWLATLLQVLHWFNPLVWFGFNRMRADRELACDALALSCLETYESKTYGQTIIKLLEGFAHKSPVPGLVGILEDKKQMKRRIQMIAQFNRRGHRGILSALLLFGLGVICLTDAQSEKQTNGISEFQAGHDAAKLADRAKREVDRVSGTITYKWMRTNEGEPDKLLSFDLQVKSMNEWRAKLTAEGGLASPGNLIPSYALHLFKSNQNQKFICFDSNSFNLPRSRSGKAPQIVPNKSEVYENAFPYWDEWAFTALWLTFCSHEFLDSASGIPGSLFTMDRNSPLRAATNFTLVLNAVSGDMGSPSTLKVPFYSDFTNVTASITPPLFEFRVTGREMTPLGVTPTRSQTRFTGAEVDAQGNLQFHLSLIIEVQVTNVSFLDSFSLGEELLSPLTVTDYRLKTQSGQPINYISTNGIPTNGDPRLLNYGNNYRMKQASMEFFKKEDKVIQHAK